MPKFMLEATNSKALPVVRLGDDTPEGTFVYIPEDGAVEPLLLLVTNRDKHGGRVSVARWTGSLHGSRHAKVEMASYAYGVTLRSGARILGPEDTVNILVVFKA